MVLSGHCTVFVELSVKLSVTACSLFGRLAFIRSMARAAGFQPWCAGDYVSSHLKTVDVLNIVRYQQVTKMMRSRRAA
jgi:hypothetical protein